MLKEKIIFPLTTALLSLLVLVILLEGILRCWYLVHNWREPPFWQRADDIGWRPSSDLSINYARKGYGEIQYSSVRDGFRRYDQENSARAKILVVGDSFTQAYHVSDGTAYFDYLSSPEMPARVFAYAAGGYGTLQQALTLEQYLPQISPNLVLWQFSGNDFINNDFYLESRSPENSSHMRRPYYIDQQIVKRHPDGLLGEIAEYSLVIRRLLVVRGSYRRRTQGSVEHELDINHSDLRRSIATTKLMIDRVSKQYPEIPILAFFAGKQYFDWELDAFAEVCELVQLECITSIPEALNAAEQNGVIIDGGRDGHWNTTGHKVAGQLLSKAVVARLAY